MKIAFVSTMTALPWGGSEVLWAEGATSALEAGHSVLVSVPSWPTEPTGVSELSRRGALVSKRARRSMIPSPEAILSRIAMRRVSLARLRLATGLSSFRQLIGFQPDVVCISEGNAFESTVIAPELLAWLASAQVPHLVVCQSNGEAPVEADVRAAAAVLYSGAACVGFVSERNWRVAERQLGIPLPRGVVLRNPVNLAQPRAEPWPADGAARLAGVGRLDADSKGQDVLFESLAGETWRHRDWTLDLFGAGRDEAYLRQLAALYGIDERIRFRGHVADIASLWAQHHLLVMASRLEGMPIALVEAMLCGRPAVVTDVGGNAELVAEGVTGFVAPAATTPSVGAALERAWSARAEWPRMGERAHDRALRHRDPAPGRTLLQRLVLAAT